MGDLPNGVITNIGTTSRWLFRQCTTLKHYLFRCWHKTTLIALNLQQYYFSSRKVMWTIRYVTLTIIDVISLTVVHRGNDPRKASLVFYCECLSSHGRTGISGVCQHVLCFSLFHRGAVSGSNHRAYHHCPYVSFLQVRMVMWRNRLESNITPIFIFNSPKQRMSAFVFLVVTECLTLLNFQQGLRNLTVIQKHTWTCKPYEIINSVTADQFIVFNIYGCFQKVN